MVKENTQTPQSPYRSKRPEEVPRQDKEKIMVTILEAGVESPVWGILRENGLIDHVKSTQDTKMGNIITAAEKLSSRKRTNTPVYNTLMKGILGYVQELVIQKTNSLVKETGGLENIHPITAYYELKQHLER